MTTFAHILVVLIVAVFAISLLSYRNELEDELDDSTDVLDDSRS